MNNFSLKSRSALPSIPCPVPVGIFTSLRTEHTQQANTDTGEPSEFELSTEKGRVMGTVRELQQLLTNLVEAWPEEYSHPTVEQAREFLDSGYTPLGIAEMMSGRGQGWQLEKSEDYYTSLWYSL